LVRAFVPTPGAWFEVAGERVKVLAAEVAQLSVENALSGTVLDDHLTIACEDDAIRPVLVQRAGRGMTSAAELLRGFPISPGTRV
jgi:methionyl-tRNA formyltransferase